MFRYRSLCTCEDAVPFSLHLGGMHKGLNLKSIMGSKLPCNPEMQRDLLFSCDLSKQCLFDND